MVANALDVIAAPVTVNEADVIPGGMVIEEATIAAGELEVIVIAAPELGAGIEIVTVPCAVVALATEFAESVTLSTLSTVELGGTTLRAAVAELPS